MDALADDGLADYINEHFNAAFLKVGTFQIVKGRKVGGNVASYFCLHDGSVLHAVAGKVDGQTLLNEARWAVELRKAALTGATNLVNGKLDISKFKSFVRQAHDERRRFGLAHFLKDERNQANLDILPLTMPQDASRQQKIHWLLASNPLLKIENVYPRVWQGILNEKLSVLPVVKQ